MSELLVIHLEQLLAAVHADDPKREILVRIGDAIREARSGGVAQRQRGPSLDAQHDAQLEGLAIGLLQRGEKSAAHIIRLAIDRLGVSAQAPTDRERAAQIIYEAFPFDGGAAEKPPWLPGGNSLMQDRARRAADAIVASARLTPAQAASEPAAYLVAHSQAIEVFQYVQNAEHCRDKMGGTITPLYASPLPSTDRVFPTDPNDPRYKMVGMGDALSSTHQREGK